MGAINGSQNWEDEFREIGTEESNGRCRVVEHRLIPDKFQLLTIFITDEDERAVMQNRLQKRNSLKPRNITRLQKLYYKVEQGYCGTQSRYELIYEYTPVRLVDHLTYRRNNGGFNFEEVLHVIYRVSLGLKDVEELGDSHGRVEMGTVVVGKQVKLQDPLSVQIKESEREEDRKWRKTSYPSPNRLLNRVDSGMHLDSFRQDLFSLGVLALQLCYPNQRIEQIYKRKQRSYQNQLIDFNVLYRFVLKVQHSLLRECIKILVSQFPSERIKVFYLLQNYKSDDANIHFFQISPSILSQEQQLAQQLRPQNQIYYSNVDSRYPRPQLSYSHIMGLKAVSGEHAVQSTHQKHSSTQPSQGNVRTNAAPPQIFYESQVVPHNSSIPFNIVRFHQSLPQRVVALPQNGPVKPLKSLNFNVNGVIPIYTQNIIQKKPSEFQVIKTNAHFIQDFNTKDKFSIANGNNIKQISFNSTQNQQKSKVKQTIQTIQPQQPIKVIEFKYDQVKQQLSKQEPKNQVVKRLFTEDQCEKQKQFKQQKTKKEPRNTLQNMSTLPITSDQPENYKNFLNSLDYKPPKVSQTNSNKVKPKPKPLKQVLVGLQEQMSQLERLTKQNQILQKQINEGAFSFFQKLTIPIAQQSILQVSGEDSQEQQAPQQSQFVVEEYESGNRYEGFMKDKKRNGYGKFYYSNGSIYDGQWIDNKMNGYGVLFYADGSIAYQGQWKDDYFNGRGVIYNDFVSGMSKGYDYSNLRTLQNDEWTSYEGQILQDRKHGKGKLVLPNGQTYQGQFYDDTVHGEGVFTQINGNRIKGVWSDGFLQTLLN